MQIENRSRRQQGHRYEEAKTGSIQQATTEATTKMTVSMMEGKANGWHIDSGYIWPLIKYDTKKRAVGAAVGRSLQAVSAALIPD